MATVIQVPRNDIGGQIGQNFGQGFGQGINQAIDTQQKQKELQQKQKLLNQVAQEISKAPTKEAALSLAGDPRFSGLFSSLEDMKQFGTLVDQQFGNPDKVKAFSAVIDGKQGTVLLTGAQQRAIATQKSTLAKELGLPEGSQADLGKLNDAGNINLVNEKTGKLTRQVPPDQLGTRKPGEVTQQGFNNMLKLKDAAAKAKKAASGGAAKSPKEFEAQALGELQSRGLPPSQENINLATNVAKQSAAFGRRAQTVFSIDPNTGLEAIKGSGKGERFQVYSSVFPELMFAGLSGSKAHQASLSLAKAIPVTAKTLDGNVKQLRPEKKIPAVKDQASAMKVLRKKPVGSLVQDVRDNIILIRVKNGALIYDVATGTFRN